MNYLNIFKNVTIILVSTLVTAACTLKAAELVDDYLKPDDVVSTETPTE